MLPARWFEIRFTCFDRCATSTRDVATHRVLDARFDVDDSSAPVGGLTGAATDAQTWSRVMHFGLNGADVGGGLPARSCRSTALMRLACRWAIRAGPAATSARTRP